MSFGSGDEWMLDEDAGRELIERAIEGISFFDVISTWSILISCQTTSDNAADVYSAGESEGILGDVLADYDRDEQVVATKVRWPDAKEHRNEGLSRKTIEQEPAHSLDRLGMEPSTCTRSSAGISTRPSRRRSGRSRRYAPFPRESFALPALDDAVRWGQVRYIGPSSMWAYQFQEAIHRRARGARARFSQEVITTLLRCYQDNH